MTKDVGKVHVVKVVIVLSWPWHADKFTIKVHILIVAIKSTLSQNSKIAQLNLSVHPYWKSMLAGLWWSLSYVEKIWRKWALKVIVTAILASTIQILLPSPLSSALLKVTMSVSLVLSLVCQRLEHFLPSTDSPTWLTLINIEKQCCSSIMSFCGKRQKREGWIEKRKWREDLTMICLYRLDIKIDSCGDNAWVWFDFCCVYRLSGVKASSERKFILRVCLQTDQ